MDYTHPDYWPQLIQLAATIDGLDYFQVLNINTAATSSDVQKAYYGLARALHPDKFFAIGDAELKGAVNRIYKRVTESYSVLRNDAKRKRYTAGVQGPDRLNRLRYSEESEQEQRKEDREAKEVAKTPQGKKLYAQAMLDMQKKNWASAFRNVQSALMFESGNDALKALKEELAAKK
ncbi:MAG: DnaJ domain-containing protein [Deltaproteobacteria bacterium]|nr:DnaJ domain-containing protein [Deltaproteobacteria bacterium]